MWDEDAVEPPPIRYFNEKLNPERSEVEKELRKVKGLMPTIDAMTKVEQATLMEFAAPCPIPEHVPKDAHMVRIAPCHGEYKNGGVFCALVKLTVGGSNVVDGWAKIYKAPQTTKAIVRTYQAVPNEKGGWTRANVRACTSAQPPASCEWRVDGAALGEAHSNDATSSTGPHPSRKLLGRGSRVSRTSPRSKLSKLLGALKLPDDQHREDAEVCAKAEGRPFVWEADDVCTFSNGSPNKGGCGMSENQVNGSKPRCTGQCCLLHRSDALKYGKKYRTSEAMAEYHKRGLCSEIEYGYRGIHWPRRRRSSRELGRRRRRRRLGRRRRDMRLGRRRRLEVVEDLGESAQFGMSQSNRDQDFQRLCLRNHRRIKEAAKKGEAWDNSYFKRCVIEKSGDATIRDAMATLRFEAANKFFTGWRPSTSDAEKVPTWQRYEGSTAAAWEVARGELKEARGA